MRLPVVRAAWGMAILVSIAHLLVSGVIFPLRTPNIGQVVEELQPVYRQMTSGAATVDHARQYGPIFLFLLDPVYRVTTSRLDLLALYCYALDVLAIGVAFYATVAALSLWLRERQLQLLPSLWLPIALLWMNFGPLYGVLSIKNVEIWELAFIAVACLAMIRGWRWTAGWCIAAAALTKMLPLIFFPYLLLRDRATFVRATVALATLLLAAQLVYGSDMGVRYLPNMIRAGAGASGYGNAVGLTWHENVAIRGIVTKAFGFLEKPDPTNLPVPFYSRGFYVIVWPGAERAATVLGVIAQLAGMGWVAWMLVRRRDWSRTTQLLWDFAFIGATMLAVAPQASHDYMVLTLGAFSFALLLCLTGRAGWTQVAVATLLVANIAPRGMFARLVLIDPILRFTGYTHLTRAEAYQYFGFPLLGLLLLARALAGARLALPGPGAPAAAATPPEPLLTRSSSPSWAH